MRCGTTVPCCFGEVLALTIVGRADVQGPGAAAGVWVGEYVWSVEEQFKVLKQ